MGDSASLSARMISDSGILDRARQLKNGALIERIQALHRKKTALKGTKDGLETGLCTFTAAPGEQSPLLQLN